MKFPDIETWQAIVAALVAVIGGLFHLRKKASEDGVEVNENKHKRVQLDLDMAELRELRTKEGEQIGRIERLEQKNRYLKRELHRLIGLLDKRKAFLPDEVRKVVETDFADFDSGDH